MNFSAAFQAPIVETIDDQEVSFPLLKSKELAPLAEMIRAKRKKDAEANAAHEKVKLGGTQLYRALQEIDEADISVPELSRFISTVPGAEKALETSLLKSGATSEQISAIIDALDPIEITSVALRVTRIIKLPKKKPDAKAGEILNNPLSGPGAQQAKLAGDSSPGTSGSKPTATPENLPSITSWTCTPEQSPSLNGSAADEKSPSKSSDVVDSPKQNDNG